MPESLSAGVQMLVAAHREVAVGAPELVAAPAENIRAVGIC